MTPANQELIAAIEPLVRRVRTDVTAIKTPTGQAWTDEPLTEARLAKHLNGGPARGVCPIKAGESVTMVALLDLDSHKGESTWDEMADAAGQVHDELTRRGLEPVAFRSRGGRGIHLIMLWDEPQDAYSVRAELVEVLAATGFTNGTGGIKKRQIEVFPKQASVPADGFGNQFILPLAGESELLVPALGFDPVGKGAVIGMAWPSSRPVAVRERPAPRPRQELTLGADMADRALLAIPNDIDSRDEWFVLLCAYAEAGGTEDVARQWTAQHGSYVEEQFVEAWRSIKVGKPDGVPASHLFSVAESCGWGERITTEFEDVSRAVTAPGEVVVAPLPMFKRDKNGIDANVTNTVLAVGRPDVIGLRLAHDQFRDDMLVGHPTRDEWRPITDADMVSVRMALERIGFKSAPKELARDAAVRVAADNVFDTAVKWAQSLHWDGVPRVETFLMRYLGCEDTPYTRAVGRYLWSAMAGRALVPGVQADMAPIFQGGQGLRKSSLIRALVPDDAFYVEVDFQAKEEDTVRSLRGALVAEIAELSGLHTRALESIKKFMTRRVEKWVPKYKEFATTFARRVVFIGTTNDVEILADSTGNRRWLPVTVSNADVEGVERDRLQLWAEGVALFHRGGVCWQDAERLAGAEHDNFRIEDSWESPIDDWLKRESIALDAPEGALNGDLPFKLNEVLIGALGVVTAAQDKLVQRRVTAALRIRGYESMSVRIAAGSPPVRRWVKRLADDGNGTRNATSVTQNLF